MKQTWRLLLFVLLLAAPAANAQFTYVTNADVITLTGYSGSGGAVTVSNFVNGIGQNAFAFCTSMTSVTIPDSVTTIEEAAFLGCNDLTSVTIPSSVTNIGVEAFLACSSLVELNVDPQNVDYSSIDGVLFDKSQVTLLECPGGLSGTYVIPDGVTSIAESAFQNCASLSGVTIPNSVTDIQSGAFQFCNGLTSITIPASVRTIADSVFWRCYGLTTIVISNGVTSIGPDAFFNCINLASVYFTGNAPYGDSSVFSGDNGTVYYLAGTTGWGSSFGGLPTALWVPGGLRVTITPAAAVSAGAQWRVDGGSWEQSGAIITNLPPGAHTVDFSGIGGWTTPSNQTVFVSTNSFATASGVYVSTSPNGSLQVSIYPGSAVSAGAQWQVDGGTAQSSGATVNFLSAGNHTVSFTSIPGWVAPSNQTVTIVDGVTTTADGLYSLLGTGQALTTLYSFTATSVGVAGMNNDGAGPNSQLVLSGSTLYGSAEYGGTGGSGTIFAVNTNGIGFINLHNFTAVNNYVNGDGANPCGGLILSGTALYGVTKEGGGGYGSVFAVNIDGTGFTPLHNFNFYDGFSPQAGLILSGSTLYGTAIGGGGSSLSGTIFAVNTDGTGFTNVYNFAGGDGGANPWSPLILSGNALYGTAEAGGTGGSGVVFSVNTDGSGFRILHSFAALDTATESTNSDGANPQGPLVLLNNTLYGTAYFGGTGGWGTIFAINTDGTGFTILHTFGYSDGSHPTGLVLSSNTLYGTTQQGGSWGGGALFAINTDATGSSTLYNFVPTDVNTGVYANGLFPTAALIASGRTLYGTAGGGLANSGTVFSFSLDAVNVQPGSLQVLISPPAVATIGAAWQVDGGPFHTSGAIVTNLSAGSHTVSFEAVGGWSTPAGQNVNVTAGTTNVITGTYAVLDVTRPTLSITSPTNGMNVKSADVTVMGTAHDNVAVSNVFYSVNGSGWAAASTTNNWAKWAAEVVLTPGTNIIQAYSVDTSGNNSTISKVTFFYPVTAPLSVTIYGGKGTTSITNGTMLDLGRGYALTASAAPGCDFIEWTGGTNIANVTFHFIMQSNLAYTANFEDVQIPTLTITTPTNGMTVTSGAFTMKGTARDNVGVASVACLLNGSPQTVTTSNSWANWNAVLALAPGTNHVTAFSTDAANNNSITHNETFFYLLKAPLTITSSGGKGTTSITNGTKLALGESYSLTADASPGFKFIGWSNGTNVTNATIHFTMVSNLAFTANYEDITPPTVSITSPTNGQVVTNFNLTVSGKASDNVAVTNVYYSTTGGTVWTSAGTSNNWTNWAAVVPLALGSNTIEAYSEDSSGLNSTTKSVTVIRQPVRTSFPVASGAGITHPEAQIAFDGSNYLVAYQTHPNGLTNGSFDVAQFVSTSDQLVGGLVNPGMSGDPPAVAFDGANYLMASLTFTQSGDYVQGVFIGTDGTTGGVTQLTQSTTVANFSTLVYGAGVYFLSWEDSGSSSTNGGFDDIYGAMVNPDGSIAVRDFQIATIGQETEAGQGTGAFDGTNFLTTWSGTSGGTSVNGRLISPSGAFITDPFTIYTNHSATAAKTVDAVVFDGTKYLVLFTVGLGSGSSTNWHIVGRFVTTAGEVLTNQINITGDVGPQIIPCGAFDGTDYLVTWNQGFNPFIAASPAGTIKGRFLNKDGVPVAPEFMLFTPAAGQTALWAPVLFDGTQFFSVGGLGQEVGSAPNLKFANGILRGAFISQ